MHRVSTEMLNLCIHIHITAVSRAARFRDMKKRARLELESDIQL